MPPPKRRGSGLSRHPGGKQRRRRGRDAVAERGNAFLDAGAAGDGDDAAVDDGEVPAAGDAPPTTPAQLTPAQQAAIDDAAASILRTLKTGAHSARRKAEQSHAFQKTLAGKRLAAKLEAEERAKAAEQRVSDLENEKVAQAAQAGPPQRRWRKEFGGLSGATWSWPLSMCMCTAYIRVRSVHCRQKIRNIRVQSV